MTSDTPETLPSSTQIVEFGQGLWLDRISRDLLEDGTLARYIQTLGVSGLTSNPTILQRAVSEGRAYDTQILACEEAGLDAAQTAEEIELADLTRAADLFRPLFDSSAGLEGWVSLEVSPLLAQDADASLQAAHTLSLRASRPNLFIKIPGTPQGLAAVEAAIFAGIPVNVTLLFSPDQYAAAAEAYLRGLERRLAGGLDLSVASVASVFVSRWDAATNSTLPAALHNRLGIAIAMQAYDTHRALLATDRWKRLAAAGASPQRLIWASTGTKEAGLAPTLYAVSLVAAGTVDTVPEPTLIALSTDFERISVMAADSREARAVTQACRDAGVDLEAIAANLQQEGVQAFSASWTALLAGIRKRRRDGSTQGTAS
jgi:transaldolase